MITTKTLVTREEKSQLKGRDQIPGFSLFYSDIVDHRVYVVAYLESRIVGIAQLIENSSRVPNAVGIGFIETHTDFRNRGVAKALVDEIFSMAKRQGKNIANTTYEPEGELWLRGVMERVAGQTPEVNFYEADHISRMTRPSLRR